jgi:hypothetical protein
MTISDAKRKLSSWEKKLANITDPVERAATISALAFRKEISAAFDKQTDPIRKKKWAKRKRSYTHLPLQKTRKYRRSWKVNVIGRADIKAHSSDKKAIWHQKGTRRDGRVYMVARPAAPTGNKLPLRWRAILTLNITREYARHFGRAFRRG